MSTICLPLNHAGIGLPPKNLGVSDTARELLASVSAAFDGLREPISLGGELWDAVAALHDVASDCSESDWDGYGAEPVDVDAVDLTLDFLFSLPTTIPSPEISVDPDGMVALDWFKGERDMFSVRLSGSGEVFFAGKYGRSRIHGSEPFLDVIPSALLDGLGRLIG